MHVMSENSHLHQENTGNGVDGDEAVCSPAVKLTPDDCSVDDILPRHDATDVMEEMLDSATQSLAVRIDLREGFETEPQKSEKIDVEKPKHSESWHRLSEDDVDQHHRSELYLHMCQPLGSVEPSSRRRKARHYASPRSAASFTPSLANVIEADSSNGSAACSPAVQASHTAESSPALMSQADVLSVECELDQERDLTDGLQNARKVESGRFDGHKSRKFRDDGVKTPLTPTDAKTDDVQKLRGPVASVPKVSFILGDPDDTEGADTPSSPAKLQPSRENSGAASWRRNSRRSPASPVTFLDPSRRCRLGSEVMGSEAMHRVPTELDEAAMLEDAHLDDMASHRFDDAKGLRRRKISHHSAMASVVHISQTGSQMKLNLAPKFKTPITQHHKMFVELAELRYDENQEITWQEKARWIKFEEEVQEDAQRWGKPHVSSLSFHSLLELRRCIEQGVIVLDLDASDMSTIANSIVDQLVTSEQLPVNCKDQMLKALLSRHTHLEESRPLLRRSTPHNNLLSFGQSQNTDTPEKIHSAVSEDVSNALVNGEHSDGRRTASLSPFNHTVAGNDDNVVSDGRTTATVSDFSVHENSKATDLTMPLLKANNQRPSLFSQPSTPTSPSVPVHHVDSNILHRIPLGTEATNVLVGSVEFLSKPVMAFVRLREACRLGNMTEVPLPVRFIFIVLGPAGSSSLDYHEIGRSISTLMADQRFHDVAYAADSRRDLLDAMNEFLQDSIVLPHGEYGKKSLLPIVDMARQKQMKKQSQRPTKVPSTLSLERDPYGDPLKRSGRLFGGLVNDVKRRYVHYRSDFCDAKNIQCVATFFFIYFACLSPAITFGGLLGAKTDKLMGVTEMLVATAVCGVIFALCSGQPLVIIGATGPIIVFEEALYKICTNASLEFLPFRCLVGLWIGVISVVVVMVDGGCLVRFVTRFTEEIFALLISLIFIYEVFKKLYYVFLRNPLKNYYPPPINCSDVNTTSYIVDYDISLTNSTAYNNSLDSASCDPEASFQHPNTALLSVILTGGTFLLAFNLKKFRNSKFFGRSVRRAIGDFGVPISIIAMVLVDFLIPDTYTEKLDVPDGLRPTARTKRNWFINPFVFSDALPPWTVVAAIIPAILVFILLYMETQITSMIVNKKERRLKKGSGYHLDLFIIGLMSVLCGFAGVPFMCSATVRSVTHVSALSVYSTTHAPGEKPRLVNTYEQRVTSLAVHIMIGISALMGPVLRQVPLAVLFGVFLYMGIASMTGVQLVHRLQLSIMPVKHHPEDVGYVRRVRLWKMNVYTLCQILCLVVLWVVKSTQAALAFPFVLTLLVPARIFLLPRIFSKRELHELDNDEETSGYHSDDEPDFYTQAHMPV